MKTAGRGGGGGAIEERGQERTLQILQSNQSAATVCVGSDLYLVFLKGPKTGVKKIAKRAINRSITNALKPKSNILNGKTKIKENHFQQKCNKYVVQSITTCW